MKLVGRIPVEPLDDERLTNIERRIVANAGDRLGAPARARRPYLGFAAATMITAAAAGFIGWKLHRDPPAIVVEAARVAVATDRTRSVLDIGDATIESSPNTTFGITRPDGGVLVEMTRGRIELEVAKRAGRAPLVVHAGDTEVIVVGTHFIVDCGETCAAGEVDVRVTEGVVRVVRGKQETRVAAGHAWRAQSGLVAIAALPERGAARDGSGEDDAIADATAGSAGPIELQPDGAIALGTPPDLRNHVAAVPDARLATSGSGAPVRSGSNAYAGGPEVTRTPRALDASSDPKFDVKTEVRREPVATPVDVQTTDPATAVSNYRTMLLPAGGTQRSGEEASRALYGIAYTQHLKLGRNADALVSTENYLRRFSGGKQYPELASVLWLRVRIHCLELVPRSDCRKAASDYVKAATGDARMHIAERVLK